MEQLQQTQMPVLLAPYMEALQRVSQALAGCAPLDMRLSCTIFSPAELKAQEVKAGLARFDRRAEWYYPGLLMG